MSHQLKARAGQLAIVDLLKPRTDLEQIQETTNYEGRIESQMDEQDTVDHHQDGGDLFQDRK